jgi:hypothetical protein
VRYGFDETGRSRSRTYMWASDFRVFLIYLFLSVWDAAFRSTLHVVGIVQGEGHAN